MKWAIKAIVIESDDFLIEHESIKMGTIVEVVPKSRKTDGKKNGISGYSFLIKWPPAKPHGTIKMYDYELKFISKYY